MNRNLVFSMCPKCKALVKVIHGCECENCGIMCCNEKMITIKPNSSDGAVEKHKPEYKIEGEYVVVTVNHVMDIDHYIEWICFLTNEKEEYVYLNPGDKPEARFKKSDAFKIYAKCNKHGIWETEM